MSEWQGCAGCGNLIPVGGYEWCGGCRPEEQDDGGAAYWRERYEDLAARFARLGRQYDEALLAVRPALARAWDEGYRLDWTGGVKWPNPYRDPDGFCTCHPDQMGATVDCGVELHRDRAEYRRLHVGTEGATDA